MQLAGDQGDEDVRQDPRDVEQDQDQDDPVLRARREEASRLCARMTEARCQAAGAGGGGRLAAVAGVIVEVSWGDIWS